MSTSIISSLRRLEREIAEGTSWVGDSSIYFGDAMRVYSDWAAPDCIISDGPYGLGKFPGEPKSPKGLDCWYAKHAAAWARRAKPSTTLWFWNSEIGWANSHAALELHGWEYCETLVWNKGIHHIAGNVNSKTIRGLPVVTEIAVRYRRRLELADSHGDLVSAKEWLRSEWTRSGLPLYRSNEATGTKNAATRKYLTQCDMWYFPPGDAVERMAAFCTENGRPTKRPYFSIDGKTPPCARAWDELRAVWNHKHGQTNVWDVPPVHHRERMKVGSAYLHANQKPLEIMKKQIELCTDVGQVIWEPFGGLCSASVAAKSLGRKSHAAELNEEFFRAACERLCALEAEAA